MDSAKSGAPRVVLDTNIWISATFWDGHPRKVIEAAIAGTIKPVLSVAILDEYWTTVASEAIIEKQRLQGLRVKPVVRELLRNATIVRPVPVRLLLDDPDDRHILGCARAARARYIVTNDKVLLRIKNYQGTSIITPQELLRDVLKKT